MARFRCPTFQNALALLVAIGSAPSQLVLMPLDDRTGAPMPQTDVRLYDAVGTRIDESASRPVQWDGYRFHADHLRDGDVYAVAAAGLRTTYVQVRSGGLDGVDQRIDFGLHALARTPFPTTRGNYTVARAIDCSDGASVAIVMFRSVPPIFVPPLLVPTPFGVVFTPAIT